jgi:apolipoprotein N-acyltransferase
VEQYVWGLDYIDSAVVRFRDSDSNGTLDETLYVVHDANFSVTAVIDTSGDAQERYTYTPYGIRTVLDGSFGARGGSTRDGARRDGRRWAAAILFVQIIE